MQSARVSSVRVCDLRSQEPESADKPEKKKTDFLFLTSIRSFSLLFASARSANFKATALLFYILPRRISQRPITVVGTLCSKRITIDLQWPACSTTSALQNWNIFFSFVYFTFLCVLVGCRKSSEPLGNHICYSEYAYYTDDVRANIFHFIVIDWSENSSHDQIHTHTHHTNLTHVCTTIAQCKYCSTVGDGRTAYRGVRSRTHRAHKISMPINNTYIPQIETSQPINLFQKISIFNAINTIYIFFYYHYCKFILSFIPYNCQHGILHAVTATPTLDAAVVVTAVDAATKLGRLVEHICCWYLSPL